MHVKIYLKIQVIKLWIHMHARNKNKEFEFFMKRKVAREKKSRVPFFRWAMESYRTSHKG